MHLLCLGTPFPVLPLLLVVLFTAYTPACSIANPIYCPFLGPVFPAPSGNLSSNSIFSRTFSTLQANLTNLLHDPAVISNTSFSIGIASIHSSNPNSSLFEFHHTTPPSTLAPASNLNVSSHTVYRIGSVSKVFTVLALLLNLQGNGTGSNVCLDDHVTKYIPELAAAATLANSSNGVEQARWEDITLRSLGSHLAGIARDYDLLDLSLQQFPLTTNGFPKLPESQIPVCAGDDEQPPCTREQFFNGFTQRYPVFAPQTTPIYSNAAFRILSYVVEAVTGQTFASVVQQQILTPLQLADTSLSIPPASTGVIPLSESVSGWNMGLGDEVAAGGIFSSTHDLLHLGRSILSSTLLSVPQTRTWLKPVTHTSDLRGSVGMPWEIRRTTITSSGRVVDLYTKDGSLGQYASLLVLVPDYGVTFTVLTAGSSVTLVNVLADTVAQAILPSLEDAAREQARRVYAGTFHAQGLDSSVTFTVDNGEPGLGVQSWISNGTDLLALYQQLNGETSGGTLVGKPRAYPTHLHDRPGAGGRTSDGKGLWREAWRVVLQTEIPDDGVAGISIFSDGCGTWGGADVLVYGQMAVDEVIFTLDEGSGMAVGLESPALRVNLTRI